MGRIDGTWAFYDFQSRIGLMSLAKQQIEH